MDNQICFCGKLGQLTFSWTISNPGRRFLGCQRYGKKGACGYFMWVDALMCARSKVVSPRLIRSIGKLKAQLKREKNVKKILVLALICSWVLWICVVALVWL